MKRRLAVVWLVMAAASSAWAQGQDAYFDKDEPFRLRGDVLFRREWTRELFGETEDQSRWRGQFRPRIDLSFKVISFTAGAELNYSSDDNVKPPEGAPALTILRDNYKSRDARLDLAAARLSLGHWLRVEGGRFPMPVPLTEMIWDRDLRPQGVAATVSLRDQEGGERFSVTALGARGSHVFEDEKSETLLASAAVFRRSRNQKAELRGSYIRFQKLGDLEPMIRRQNSRLTPGGPVVPEFEVIDLVGRIASEGALPSEIVVDYCWNRRRSEANKGFWLAVALGSTATARSRGEYTFARVGKDATVAAYATDDFFWGTGWEGHRVDFGVRTGQGSSVHTVAQLIRFKDSPNEEERDHWIQRARIELRWVF